MAKNEKGGSEVYHKILVPLDGSKVAETVLPHLYALEKYTHATITLLRAVPEKRVVIGPLNPDGFSGIAGIKEQEEAIKVLQETEENNAQAYLELIAKNLEHNGVIADIKVKKGEAADIILNLSQNNQFDLVAMSTHGYGGIVRTLMGSVADQVIQHINLPVLLIRAKHVEEDVSKRDVAYRRILVPYDGHEMSEAIVPAVVTLAKAAVADVVLLHVMPEPIEAARTAGMVGIKDALTSVLIPSGKNALPHTGNAYDAMIERERSGAQSMLDTAAMQFRSQGIRTETIVDFGNAIEVILRTAQDLNFDLVAMGTHARGGLARITEGSISDQLIRHGPVPVLLVRPNVPH